MSVRLYGYINSIRRALLQTLIRRLHDCTSMRPCYRWIVVRGAAAFEMSSAKEVARAINRFVREGLNLLGS